MSEVTHIQDGRAMRYIRNVILGYLGDPPESDFQAGYLAGMLDLYREELGGGDGDDRIKAAARLVYPEA